MASFLSLFSVCSPTVLRLFSDYSPTILYLNNHYTTIKQPLYKAYSNIEHITALPLKICADYGDETHLLTCTRKKIKNPQTTSPG